MENELLEQYFQLYQKQTAAKCPYYNPHMKSQLQGVEMNGMVMYDSPEKTYRRIYRKTPTTMECSVLYVDSLDSFEGISVFTIVVAKKLLVTSPSHIVITSELTTLDNVPMHYFVDDLVIKHYLNHSKSFYIPELLDMHAIDGFVPSKDMDKFVGLMDKFNDLKKALSLTTAYPGHSRLRIFEDNEIDADLGDWKNQKLPAYDLKSKLDNYKKRVIEYGCPYPKSAKTDLVCPYANEN